MKKEHLKQKVCAAIDKRADEIIAIGDFMFNNPELGYKELQAAALVEEKFQALGLEYRKGLAITGLKSRLPGRQSK
ncbi:MAG TPA: amidohydrolase, partial [Firmicutes bacterium]|nr:amidohydrolase [Bacillota bacterium]